LDSFMVKRARWDRAVNRDTFFQLLFIMTARFTMMQVCRVSESAREAERSLIKVYDSLDNIEVGSPRYSHSTFSCRRHK
jgi:hypothetical protein